MRSPETWTISYLQVGFCSTLCRDEAWASYHPSECELTDSLHCTNVGKNGLLALRTILKVGRQRIIDANQHEECLPIGKVYDSSDYDGTIHRLVGNTSQRSVADLFRRSVKAVYLTSFIEPYDEILAAAALRIIQSYPCNAHEISHLAVPLPFPFPFSLIAKDSTVRNWSCRYARFESYKSFVQSKCCPNLLRRRHRRTGHPPYRLW